MTWFHEELLSRFGPEGTLACSCGAEHRLRLREVIMGEGALEESADRVSRGPASSVWVLSDEYTDAAAGAPWKARVRGKRVLGRILPAWPRPVPTDSLVAELSAEVRAAPPDLVVAVGSGVVSDLGKAVSHEVGLPGWSIATAASVDAYTSGTAAIRVGGYHRALPTAPSQVVVCDLGVLAAAPRPLFLAGLGDLLAKFLARVDWRLSNAVTGEAFCEPLASAALDSARQAVQAAELSVRDPAAAAAALIDAGLVSGMCMQATGSSRPAAGSEHGIAHFWEMAGAVTREENDLHGLLVGAASRPVLRGYAETYPRLGSLQIDPAARRAALDAEPGGWEEALPPEMARFRGTLDAVARARAPMRAALPARLAAFARHREQLAELAGPVLEELSGAVGTLRKLGFPFSPAELGLAEPWLTLGVRHVRRLRDRYTTFDLAHDLGLEPSLLAAVEAGLGEP
jgi:glycerol-1-phosphate dehydrogenase [NAD(P)+]